MTGPPRADAPHFPAAEDRSQGAPARGSFARVLATVRRIIGVPDYAAYVRHMSHHHPGLPVLSAGEFAEEQLQAKYSRPGSRCC